MAAASRTSSAAQKPAALTQFVSTRLLDAAPLEWNDWALQHRTRQVEGMAELDTPQLEEGSTLQITPTAA